MNILVVIVIYNQNYEETNACRSLVNLYNKDPNIFVNLEFLFYDNSPGWHEGFSIIPFVHTYKHDPQNGGVCAAYNCALGYAVSEGHGWLLLLDQDTYLSEGFLHNFTTMALSVEKDEAIAAVVPKVRHNGTIISPSEVMFCNRFKPVSAAYKGVSDFKITSINSGSLLKVSFLKNIGGFSRLYWLDYLDQWLFCMINMAGKRVYVIDEFIDHELSLLDYDKLMSKKRYRNILKSEAIFFRSMKTRAENLFYTIKLLNRAFRQMHSVKDKEYYVITLKHLGSCFWRNPFLS